MDIIKWYSRRSVQVIAIFGVLWASATGVFLYVGADWLAHHFSGEIDQSTLQKNAVWLIQQIDAVRLNYFKMILPVIVGVVFLSSWLLWWVLRSLVSRMVLKRRKEREAGEMKDPRKNDFVDHKIEEDRKRRLFLYALSILQREGRLLDFLQEDLSRYEDEQIGAAVRSIQEDCKKAVKKYIDLKPVVEQEEGQIVRLEPGFDMDAVKLTGNVSGEPPFEGLLKHRGWKAGKKETPKLSDVQDSSVITPAEIELQ